MQPYLFLWPKEGEGKKNEILGEERSQMQSGRPVFQVFSEDHSAETLKRSATNVSEQVLQEWMGNNPKRKTGKYANSVPASTSRLYV